MTKQAGFYADISTARKVLGKKLISILKFIMY